MSDYPDENYDSHIVYMDLEQCLAYMKSKITYDSFGHYRPFAPRPLAMELTTINEQMMQFEIFLVEESPDYHSRRKGKIRLKGYIQQMGQQLCQVSYRTESILFYDWGRQSRLEGSRFILIIIVLFIVIGLIEFNLGTRPLFPLVAIALVIDQIFLFQAKKQDIQRIYDALPQAQ